MESKTFVNTTEISKYKIVAKVVQDGKEYKAGVTIIIALKIPFEPKLAPAQPLHTSISEEFIYLQTNYHNKQVKLRLIVN